MEIVKSSPAEGRSWFIYHLLDPDSNEIRYVGLTFKSPAHRFNIHVAHARTGIRKTRSGIWIRGLLAKGKMPVLVIAKTGIGDSGYVEEIREILKCREAGCRLTNLCLGGGGRLGLPHSEETKRKLSEAHKKITRNRKWTDEQRQKFVKTRTGMSRPEKTNQQVRDLWKNKRPISWGDRDLLVQLYQDDSNTWADIATKIGCSIPMLYKLFNEHKIERNRKVRKG